MSLHACRFRFTAALAMGCFFAVMGTVTAAEAPARKIYLVDDFGAKPGSASNAAGAVRRALEAAMAGGAPAEIRFGAGTYRLSTDEPMKSIWSYPACVVFEKATNLWVRGVPGKTRLIVTRPDNSLFQLNECQGMRFEDFSVDYDPLPFTQGRLVRVDSNTLSYEVRLDEGYDPLDRPWFTARAMAVMAVHDPETCPDLVPGEVVVPSSNQVPLGGRLWRLSSQGPWQKKFDPTFKGPDMLTNEYVRAGARMVFAARGGGSVFMLKGSDGVAMNRIVAHTAPGHLLNAWHGSDLSATACAIRPPEGSGRLRTTCADGIHLKNVRGMLRIEGCHMEKMGDDSINFHATGLYVEKVVSESEWVLYGKGWTQMVRPGDLLQVLDPKMHLKGEVRVTNLALLDEGRRYQVQIAGPLPGITAGNDRTGDLVFNLDGCPRPFVVRSNHLESETEILPRGLDGLIEGNTFVATTAKQAIVMLAGGAPWFEGPCPRNIRIQSNFFRGQRLAQIWLQGNGELRNIEITGNRFQENAGMALWMNGVRDIYLRGNQITSSPQCVRGKNPYSCLSVEAAEGVRIEDLLVEDGSDKLRTVVRIAKTVKPAEEGVTVRRLRAKIKEGVPPILDERVPGP